MSRTKTKQNLVPVTRNTTTIFVPESLAPLARATAKCNSDELELVAMLLDIVTALHDRDDIKSAWMSEVAARMPWMLDAAAYGFLPAVRS